MENDADQQTAYSTGIVEITPTRKDCTITETEIVERYEGGFAIGMWLSDFQVDGMILHRDKLEGRETLAIRAAPHMTMLTLWGLWFAKRNLRARMGD